jgi:hypothetical protein
MNNEITFIGTSHIDPKGHERISKLLISLHPQIIVLEMSRFAILFRKTIGNLCRKVLTRHIEHLQLHKNREITYTLQFFALPYEYRAAKQYARSRNVQVILMDVSLFSFLRLIQSFRMLKRENVLSLASMQEDRFVREKITAERIFNRDDLILARIKLTNFERDSLLRMREKVLIRRLTNILSRYHDKNILYIGGWEHLIDNSTQRNLYSNINAVKRRIIPFLD